MTGMLRPRLCLDIDNCLARTDEVMRRLIREFTNGRVNLEYEHITQFDYHACADGAGNAITKPEWDEVHKVFSQPSIILALAPFEGAVEGLRRLVGSFDLHLATSRRIEARRPTIEWLEMHQFPLHDLHFLKHGEKHASLARFFAAVEDHYEQAESFAVTQTPCFLIEHPWNRGRKPRKGIRWVNGWAELTEHLASVGECLGALQR
jgi:uncharacterized HAD superfamily protein